MTGLILLLSVAGVIITILLRRRYSNDLYYNSTKNVVASIYQGFKIIIICMQVIQ